MKAIGFRCAPKFLSYAVLEFTDATPTLLTSALVKVPAGMSEAQAMVWARREASSIAQEAGAAIGALKHSEPMARQGAAFLTRHSIESVVREGVASEAALVLVPVGWAQIAAQIGTSGKELKKVARRAPEIGLPADSDTPVVEAALAAWAVAAKDAR